MTRLVILQASLEQTGGKNSILILFLIIVVGFVFLNGKIAKWKGYPFWAGAISGIVLFWGTILFLVMPFNRKK